MKLKCAVFDFDGTLFDSMYVWDNAGDMYLRSLGRTPGPHVREALRSMSLYQTACYFRREYCPELTEDKIMEDINRTVEGLYFHEVQPKPGVVPFLEELRADRILLAVATATDRYQIEAALTRCGMAGLFDALFTCSEVGHGKDEPVIFREAMAHFGADRENTVIFEDALHAIRTAKEDGFYVAAVRDGSEPRQEEVRALADIYIPDFFRTEEFLRFVSSRP